MNKQDIEKRCRVMAYQLLDKYYGNLPQEAGEQIETLDEKYAKDLPLKVEKEFLSCLDQLKAEILPNDTRPIEDLIDCPINRSLIREDYEPFIEKSYTDATTITFWEKVSKGNHEDVALYKGIIKQFTEELLDHMINDFLNLGERL